MPKRKSKSKKSKTKSSLFCVYSSVILCMFLATTVLMSTRLGDEKLSRRKAWTIEAKQEHDDADLCNSEDPCHCHKTKEKCLCLYNSGLGFDCIESGCNWHGIDEDTDMYRLRKRHHHATISRSRGFCDSCSALHCHGCSSQDTCELEDPIFGESCKWMKSADEEYCESICSSSHCHACTSKDQCDENIMCRWSPDMLDFEIDDEDREILCLPRCDVHSCEGCISRSSCEGANRAHGAQNAGCEWDAEAQTCFRECVPAGFRDQHGEGCFTCETKSLCDSQAHHGCEWDEEIFQCTGNEILSVWYVSLLFFTFQAIPKT